MISREDRRGIDTSWEEHYNTKGLQHHLVQPPVLLEVWSGLPPMSSIKVLLIISVLNHLNTWPNIHIHLHGLNSLRLFKVNLHITGTTRIIALSAKN